MFPNLEAEQARNRHTDEYVASKLGISRQMYGRKKSLGNFKLKEINTLLEMYGTDFTYLFAMEAETA